MADEAVDAYLRRQTKEVEIINRCPPIIRSKLNQTRIKILENSNLNLNFNLKNWRLLIGAHQLSAASQLAPNQNFGKSKLS